MAWPDADQRWDYGNFPNSTPITVCLVAWAISGAILSPRDARAGLGFVLADLLDDAGERVEKFHSLARR